MAATTPALIPENTGLAFVGEAAWAPAILTDRQAEKFAASPNACGRPNADVMRRRLAVVRGDPTACWQIDFPSHFTAQEAALYERPWAWLHERTLDGSWLNPHAQPALRRALARVSRFLALPTNASGPDWRWIEEDLLPDVSLLVVARDDDFMHGVLQSALFATWWRTHQRSTAPRHIVESFPFPWPPASTLAALTAAQEENRHAIARAVRSGNEGTLNAAVLAAYGWPAQLSDRELREKLSELNHGRGVA